jgi:hypothetical protein
MLRGAIGRFGTVLAGLLCLGASPSRGNVALEYHEPPGCAGESVFRERVEDLYDFREVFVPPGPGTPFLIRVTIEHLGTNYRGTIKLLEVNGKVRSRMVELHESCDALVYDVAHRVRSVVSTDRPPASPSDPPPVAKLDPETEKKLWRRLDHLEETTEALEEKNEAQDEQIAKLKRDLEDERKKRMNLTYSLATGALMTINLTSNVGPGVWVSGGLWSGPLGLAIDLRAVLPSRVAVGPYDLDLSQFVGLLTPCGRYSIFFGCAVAGAGLQIEHDSNFDPNVPPTNYSPLVQLGGRVGVEVPLGESRYAIRGWGEVLYSTPSVRFNYGEGTTVTHSVDRPDVSGFIGLGFVVRLGDEKEGAK